MTFRMIPWIAGFSLLLSVLPCRGEQATCTLVDQTRAGDFEVECPAGFTLTVNPTRRLDRKPDSATFTTWGRALLVQGQGSRTTIQIVTPKGAPSFILRDRSSSLDPKPTINVRKLAVGWLVTDNDNFECKIVNKGSTCEITGGNQQKKPDRKPVPEPEQDEDQGHDHDQEADEPDD